jgi:hypothetical protein
MIFSISLTCDKLKQRGFSQNTFLFDSRNVFVNSKCVVAGVTINTVSISLLFMISSNDNKFKFESEFNKGSNTYIF